MTDSLLGLNDHSFLEGVSNLCSEAALYPVRTLGPGDLVSEKFGL
jgi:hypothetical protein